MRRARIDEDRADLFTCVGCKRRVPAAFGCDDDMPGHCDDCWVKAHGESLGPSNDDIPQSEKDLAAMIVDIVELWEPHRQNREIDLAADRLGRLRP